MEPFRELRLNGGITEALGRGNGYGLAVREKVDAQLLAAMPC